MATKRKRLVEPSELEGNTMRKRSRPGTEDDFSLPSEGIEMEESGDHDRSIILEAAKAVTAPVSEFSIEQDGETSSSGSDSEHDTSESTSSLDEESSSSTGTTGTLSDNGDSSPAGDRHVLNTSLLMTPQTSASNGADLRARILSFLPQLREANADLQNPDTLPERRIDEVEDDQERYIEMNLGLGVLKEKKKAQTSDTILTKDSSPSDSDDSDSDSIGVQNTPGMRDDGLPNLTHLMGGPEDDKQKPSISEVLDG